jgi:hypothetical protein
MTGPGLKKEQKKTAGQNIPAIEKTGFVRWFSQMKGYPLR